jgi:hypothetical protein
VWKWSWNVSTIRGFNEFGVKFIGLPNLWISKGRLFLENFEPPLKRSQTKYTLYLLRKKHQYV